MRRGKIGKKWQMKEEHKRKSFGERKKSITSKVVEKEEE